MWLKTEGQTTMENVLRVGLGSFLKNRKHRISPVDTGQGQMSQDQSFRRLTAEPCISLHGSFSLCFLNYRFALI